MRVWLLILFAVFSITIIFSRQQDKQVRISPKAETKQTVGFTDVVIEYSRPAVRERKIWGGLVPYSKVWRAGANEATKFIFTDDVLIEGKKLSKGSYSFFAIPGEKEWTLIFNKVSDQWGAFEYNEAEDALRIKVKPEKNNSTEWLTYNINKISDSAAIVSLEWENLKIPFKVEAQL
jgi:hypothetical protein